MNKILFPIVLDLEMSGLDKIKCGIWQIGAIDLNNPSEFFLEESRIDDDDYVEEDALKVIGKSEEYLRNPAKQSQRELLEKFFEWMRKRPLRNVLCQNPQADIGFLEVRAKKYGLKKTMQHRAFDLHSIAQAKYFYIYGEFLIREGKDTTGWESNMNLTNVLKFCGIPDNRMILIDGKTVHEGKPHNALEDCKLTGECFYRLILGKNIFPEYSEFEIPKELK